MSATLAPSPGGSHEEPEPADTPSSLPRYLTLAAARALECNGCGDCCDSRRTDGFWTWGALPEDQYAGLLAGRPLIIPLERAGGGWAERARTAADGHELSPTRFRCVAFEPQPDGAGRCGLHLSERPQRCGEFPVWGAPMEAELDEYGEVALATSAFPRCTWYRVTVVVEGDVRLQAAIV